MSMVNSASYFFIGSLTFSGLIGLAFYLLKAFAIYEMSKSAGEKYPWLAFIPFANQYAFGRLAERYGKRDGTPSMKFRIVLPVLGVIAEFGSVVIAVRMILLLVSTLLHSGILENEISEDAAIDLLFDTGMLILPLLLGLLVIGIVAILYAVFYYIAYWRIASIFDFTNATLYTVLGIFFSFLMPIFLFIIRKREPKFTYSDRMGQYTERY